MSVTPPGVDADQAAATNVPAAAIETCALARPGTASVTGPAACCATATHAIEHHAMVAMLLFMIDKPRCVTSYRNSRACLVVVESGGMQHGAFRWSAPRRRLLAAYLSATSANPDWKASRGAEELPEARHEQSD